MENVTSGIADGPKPPSDGTAERAIIDAEPEVDANDNTDIDESGDPPAKEEEVEKEEESEVDSDAEPEPEIDVDLDEGETPSNLVEALKKSGVLKKHPELRDIVRREEAFTETFATPEEAKIAADKSQVFNHLESKLMSGSISELLTSIKAENNEKFLDLASNILPTIMKMDKDVYADMVRLPLKQALRAAAIEAKKADNNNLYHSAINLNEFLFGEEPLTKDPVARKPKEENEEVKKFQQEKQEWHDRQLNHFNSGVNEIVESRLKTEVTTSLATLKLNTYSKTKLTEDILKEVATIINSDRRFTATQTALFKKASEEGFSSEWKSKLANTATVRCKAALAIARKKVLADAKVIASDKPASTARRIVPSGGGSDKSRTTLDPRKIDFSKTSERDILSDDPSRIKFKR